MEKVYDKSLAFLKWVLIVLFALMVAFQLTGCNTMAGTSRLIRGAADLVGGIATDVEIMALGTQKELSEQISTTE